MLARAMVSLRELGAHAHLFSQAGDDLGFCHLPWPVSVGDLAMVEDTTYRILELADLTPGGAVDLLAVVARAQR
jgi:hypothetical protein